MRCKPPFGSFVFAVLFRVSVLGQESLFPGGKRRTRSDAGQPLAPKYKGPNGETWSGRGRQPTWLTELEAVGHDKSEFLIKAEE